MSCSPPPLPWGAVGDTPGLSSRRGSCQGCCPGADSDSHPDCRPGRSLGKSCKVRGESRLLPGGNAKSLEELGQSLGHCLTMAAGARQIPGCIVRRLPRGISRSPGGDLGQFVGPWLGIRLAAVEVPGGSWGRFGEIAWWGPRRESCKSLRESWPVLGKPCKALGGSWPIPEAMVGHLHWDVAPGWPKEDG